MPNRTPQAFLNAFIYNWRLWTVPELRDAMSEVGFAHTQVYPRTAEAKDAHENLYAIPVEDHTELGEHIEVIVNDAVLGVTHELDSPLKDGDRITLLGQFMGG